MQYTVELSEEAYRTLQATARARGISIAELMQSWVATLEYTAPANDVTPRTRDPLAPFLGTFEATVPDLLRRHDDYLADDALDRHAAP